MIMVLILQDVLNVGINKDEKQQKKNIWNNSTESETKSVIVSNKLR